MKEPATFITEYPLLRVRDLLAAGRGDGLFRSFYGADAALFYFGRGALWQAVAAMNVAPDEHVLVPSYHCGVEIEAVAMTGAGLRYYAVREDLSVDLADLAARADRGSKALLLIHYFGFPQPVAAVRTFCSERGILLIEDCSQALFSTLQGRPLGTFGDVAVFSQRKTLPLPDGGALLINNPALASPWRTEPCSTKVALKKTAGLLLRSLFRLNPREKLPFPLERAAAALNRRVARQSATSYSTGLEIDVDRCRLASSGLARWIMERTESRRVIGRRRDNYLSLLANLAATPHLRLVRDRLEDGVCPLFFPVSVEGLPRGAVQEALMAQGIASFVFGEELHQSLPKEQFPEAAALSRKVLCLPVHQNLGAREMASMAKALVQVTREIARAAAH